MLERVASQPISPISESDATNCAKEYIGVHVVTPVWGDAYIRNFLEVILPLHLSPNNVPALAEREGTVYIVYTRQCDVSLFLSNELFRVLRRVVRTELRVIPEPITTSHGTMSDCYRDALRRSNGTDAALIFLAGDTVVSDDTFAALATLADNGKRCVFAAGPRVVAETFSAAIRARRDGANGVAIIPPREMTRLALAHLHPISWSHLWNSEYFNTYPSHLYWKVKEEGFLARCFHLHPILVRPINRDVPFRRTIDDDYIIHACPDPETIHIITDSDEASVYSMTPRDMEIGNSKPHRSSEAYLAWWSKSVLSAQHVAFAQTPVCFHVGQTSPMWQVAEIQSRDILSDIEAIREYSNARLLLCRPALFTDKITLQALMSSSNITLRSALIHLRAKCAQLRSMERNGLEASSYISRQASRVVLYLYCGGVLCACGILVLCRGPIELPNRVAVVAGLLWNYRATVYRVVGKMCLGDRDARSRFKAWLRHAIRIVAGVPAFGGSTV